MGRRREGAPARDGALPLGWAPLAMGRCCEGDPRAGWGVAAKARPALAAWVHWPMPAAAKERPTMVPAGLRF